jgi:hypothetical protein
MLAGSACGEGPPPRYAQSAPPRDEVRLTLSSQTVWQGQYGWCSRSASIRQSSGGVSGRCGGAGPFGTASPGPGASPERSRTLTDAEVATLRNLYQEAKLFDGGHIGADFSGGDFPFYILIIPIISAESRCCVGGHRQSDIFKRSSKGTVRLVAPRRAVTGDFGMGTEGI